MLSHYRTPFLGPSSNPALALAGPERRLLRNPGHYDIFFTSVHTWKQGAEKTKHLIRVDFRQLIGHSAHPAPGQDRQTHAKAHGFWGVFVGV